MKIIRFTQSPTSIDTVLKINLISHLQKLGYKSIYCENNNFNLDNNEILNNKSMFIFIEQQAIPLIIQPQYISKHQNLSVQQQLLQLIEESKNTDNPLILNYCYRAVTETHNFKESQLIPGLYNSKLVDVLELIERLSITLEHDSSGVSDTQLNEQKLLVNKIYPNIFNQKTLENPEQFFKTKTKVAVVLTTSLFSDNLKSIRCAEVLLDLLFSEINFSWFVFDQALDNLINFKKSDINQACKVLEYINQNHSLFSEIKFNTNKENITPLLDSFYKNNNLYALLNNEDIENYILVKSNSNYGKGLLNQINPDIEVTQTANVEINEEELNNLLPTYNLVFKF